MYRQVPILILHVISLSLVTGIYDNACVRVGQAESLCEVSCIFSQVLRVTDRFDPHAPTPQLEKAEDVQVPYFISIQANELRNEAKSGFGEDKYFSVSEQF